MEYLRPVFNCLAKLIKPPDTELIIITDGDAALEQAVDRRLDSINFRRIQVISFGDIPAEDIDSRRYRISAIHNKAKHFVTDKCEYVMLVEDDTTYPPDALNKMLKIINYNENCGYVEGIELGRRKTPYLGAWKADDLKDPHEIVSIMPSHGVQNIDAGGFYCALTNADTYRNHYFEPFDKVGKIGLSCDVNYCLYLRNQGLDCIVDHSIQCDHIGDKGSVNLGNTKPTRVIFEKTKNKWFARTVV